MKIYHCIYTLLIASNLMAQVGSFWTKAYGGTDYDDAMGSCSLPTGEILICGYTESFGAGKRDAYVIKTDENGNTIWAHTYGESGHDAAFSIIPVSTGGYIFAGYHNNSSTSYNDIIWVVRIDDLGDTLWTHSSGLGTTSGVRTNSIKETSDGGFIIVGDSFVRGSFDYIDAFVLKITSEGVTQWYNTFRSTRSDGTGTIHGYNYGEDIIQTEDGGYLLTGTSTSWKTIAGFDMLLMKLNSSGNKLWERWYGTSDARSWEYGNSIIAAPDGGYLILGTQWQDIRQDARIYDLYLWRISVSGDTLWTQYYGGDGNDYGESISASIEGGYMLLGTTYSYDVGKGDFWIIKIDESGSAIWDHTFGGTEIEFSEQIHQTIYGHYVVTGTTYSYGPGTKSNFYALGIDVLPPRPIVSSITSGENEVYISWYPSPAPDIAQYIIFGSEMAGFTPVFANPLVQIASPDTSYNHSALIKGITQYYRMVAVDEAGNISSYSPEISATPRDTIPPSTATGLSAIARDQEITLSWDKNPEDDIAWYYIYQGTSPNILATEDDSVGAIDHPDTSLVIADLENNLTYYYKVRVMDTSGNESDLSEEVDVTPFTLEIQKPSQIPDQFALHQNFPNPFNPTSTIQYDLPEVANVTLIVYDIVGREVIRLVDQQMLPGYHTAVWNAKDHTGSAMPTGIYIARLVTPEYTRSIKMVLLK